MAKYERLTYSSNGKIMFHGYNNLIVSRLFDLENQIERGELIAQEEVEAIKAENAVLRERLGKAMLNRCIYYLASIWNDATMTRSQEVRCRTVDYVCDKFVECNGLTLNWDEIYFTREAAEARVAELKGENK